MDPNFRYATVRREADGVTTDWEVSFSGGYISPSHIFAYSVALEESPPGSGEFIEVDRQEHAVEVLSGNGISATVRVAPAVADERVLTIYRNTPKAAPLSDFTDGRRINQANLQLLARQSIMNSAEIVDYLNERGYGLATGSETIVNQAAIEDALYTNVLNRLNTSGIFVGQIKTWHLISPDGAQNVLLSNSIGDGWGDTFDPDFYEVSVDGILMVPGLQYTVIEALVNPLGAKPAISFSYGINPGSSVLVVQRANVAAIDTYTIKQPRVPVLTFSVLEDATLTNEFALFRSTGTNDTFNIKAYNDPFNMVGVGSYFSVQQTNGQVQITGDPGVTIETPAGFLPRTAGQYSIVTATCVFEDTWTLSGDLARIPA
jgi:hypothetical protein